MGKFFLAVTHMNTALNWEVYDSDIPIHDPAQVARLEATLGVKLPQDYVDAVNAHAGKSTSLEQVDIGKGSSVFGTLFFICDDAAHRGHYNNVYKALDDVRDWSGKALVEFVPFSSNTSSGLYCFDYRQCKQNPSVVFVDLEREPAHERALIPLASSFSEFLSKLY